MASKSCSCHDLHDCFPHHCHSFRLRVFSIHISLDLLDLGVLIAASLSLFFFLLLVFGDGGHGGQVYKMVMVGFL